MKTFLFYVLKIQSEVGIEEQQVTFLRNTSFGASIITGSIRFPQYKNCKILDITGRVVLPAEINPGLYFLEVDGQTIRKIVIVR